MYRATLLAPATLLLAAAFCAAQTPDPKALVEKAIAAHGGAEAIDKYPAARVESKGKLYQGADETPFTSRVVYQTPDKLCSTVEVAAGKLKYAVVNIIAGDKVETFLSGVAQQVSPGQVEELKMALAVETDRRLTPLLKNPKVKLAAAPVRKVDNKELPGVKVSQPGQKDVLLYFEVESNLLKMLERRGHDSAGKSVTVQEVYGDYREVEGVKYPAKTVIRHDGQRYVVTETTKFEPLERADPKELLGAQ